MIEDSQGTGAFEALIGVRFKDSDLLEQALTHSSFVNENASEVELQDNERLEFLGDAVLDIVVADMLFRRFPRVSEGELSQLRAALVREESLAQIGAKFRLGEHLRLGHGEEISGGRRRQSTLCRAFEAVIGAIYLDRGLSAVVDFVLPPVVELLDEIIKNDLHLDARSELQERIQARLNIVPNYRVIGEAGPEHEKLFRVDVAVGEAIIGSGQGGSKRAAAQAAAADAMSRLDVGGLPDNILTKRAD